MSDSNMLGWSDFFEMQWAALGRDDWVPARVAFENRGHCLLIDAQGNKLEATISGRLRNQTTDRADRLVVGDWVAARAAGGTTLVEHRLERRTAFTRRAVAERGVQVVAANVDLVLVVTSLNRDFNERRLERYVTTVYNSGAAPVLVLNKADLVADPGAFVERLGPAATGLPVYVLSARDGLGLEPVQALVQPGRTLALVGSSGVGKSTLVNRLLGEDRQVVSDIRADDARGRHTTTGRELIAAPGGGWIIDTPGMRELGVVGANEGVALAFDDVEGVASACRFRDCTHEGEPGCAVEVAVACGALAPDRLAGYRKLKRELAYARGREDAAAARKRAQTMKKLTKSYRSRPNKRVD